MDDLSATLASVALQLLIGTALLGAGAVWLGRARSRISRRGRAAWLRASREMRRIAPAALIALVASLLLRSWSAGRPALDLEPVTLVRPGGVSIAGAISTSGCYLIWRAGRLESRGRRRIARRLGRLAGGAILTGVAVLVTLIAGSAAPASGSAASSLAAGIFLGATGFAAVLAGLSGKPRPGGQVAVLLYLAAVALLAHARG